MTLHRRHWLLLLALPPLFWAGNALVGRAVVGQVPPLALAFWRWVVALALALPFTWREIAANAPMLRRRWRLLLALGVTSVGAYNTLLYLAVQTTTAINATLVGASMPLMILALAATWLGQPIGWRQAGGILVSLLGLVVVVTHGQPALLLELRFAAGDGLMLLATLSWAVYSVMLKRYPLAIGGLALLTVLMAVGLVAILPCYLWELASGARMAAGWQAPAAIAYTALIASLAAYTLWNRCVAEVGATLAGQYTYLLPMFTALLAVLLLGEPFHWHHAIGGGLIFAGIGLANGMNRESGRR